MARKKIAKGLTNTRRLPSVEECENCAYQTKCQGGKYCTAGSKKGDKK